MSLCWKCEGFYPDAQIRDHLCIWCKVSDKMHLVASGGDGNTNGQGGIKTSSDGSGGDIHHPTEGEAVLSLPRKAEETKP